MRLLCSLELSLLHGFHHLCLPSMVWSCQLLLSWFYRCQSRHAGFLWLHRCHKTELELQLFPGSTRLLIYLIRRRNVWGAIKEVSKEKWVWLSFLLILCNLIFQVCVWESLELWAFKSCTSSQSKLKGRAPVWTKVGPKTIPTAPWREVCNDLSLCVRGRHRNSSLGFMFRAVEINAGRAAVARFGNKKSFGFVLVWAWSVEKELLCPSLHITSLSGT